jgi:co-chaperonin GroES (HSP10)
MIPIGKNIIIKAIEQEIETDSGLLLSAQDNNQLRYKKALVIKSGTDVSVIKDGDTIYYDKHAGHTMMLNDQQYTLILERDVVLVGE